MCRPHCWQYANPSGVAVPQRGQLIVLDTAPRTSGLGVRPESSARCGAGAGAGAACTGIACNERDAPQLRQNFIPGGFSPRQS
jgi:hypothetical protein